MPNTYVHAEILVAPDWVAANFSDPSVVVAEVNADLDEGYRLGHVPGAVGWSLHTDLEDQVRRDLPNIAQIESLLGRSGIGNDTTVVLYGDGDNRPATWAFWVLKYFGHADVRLMNGGRSRWIREARDTSVETPTPVAKEYRAKVPDRTIRATRDYILKSLRKRSVKLLDTRTYEEFSGQLASAPGTPHHAISRLGRIPGAVHVPWEDAVAETGDFKSADDLTNLYAQAETGMENEIITYCRTGLRASYTWFVLKYLLGYPTVRNYDGSWTEWGNSVGVPVETGDSVIAQP